MNLKSLPLFQKFAFAHPQCWLERQPTLKQVSRNMFPLQDFMCLLNYKNKNRRAWHGLSLSKLLRVTGNATKFWCQRRRRVWHRNNLASLLKVDWQSLPTKLISRGNHSSPRISMAFKMCHFHLILLYSNWRRVPLPHTSRPDNWKEWLTTKDNCPAHFP